MQKVGGYQAWEGAVLVPDKGLFEGVGYVDVACRGVGDRLIGSTGPGRQGASFDRASWWLDGTGVRLSLNP